nr:hypothetical protein [Tanacetum cinerariifolium]
MTFGCLTIEARSHTAKTFDLVWMWLDSEQMTHEFIHVYLVFASVYVWIGIETTNEGTKILATIDGKPMTISESSIRRNLKLNDEKGITTLPDAELFENLALMGYNILPNQNFTFQKGFNEFSSNTATAVGEGSGTPTEPHHTPTSQASQLPHHDLSSSLHLIKTTATIPTSTPTEIPTLRQQTKMDSKIVTQDLEISSLKAKIKLLEDRDKGTTKLFGDDAPIKGMSLETEEEA